METKREIKKTFGTVLERQIPEVMRVSGSNIALGIVVAFNTGNRTSTVRIRTTGQSITNAKVSKQIVTLHVGDEVVILSTDKNFTSRNYIVASFGGNFSATTNVGT